MQVAGEDAVGCEHGGFVGSLVGSLGEVTGAMWGRVTVEVAAAEEPMGQ